MFTRFPTICLKRALKKGEGRKVGWKRSRDGGRGERGRRQGGEEGGNGGREGGWKGEMEAGVYLDSEMR